MKSPPGRLGCVLGVALAVFVVAFAAGLVRHRGTPGPELAEYAPLPHRVPSREGGLVFRFAMAHDVLHERYPRSGPAYHRERIRVTRAELAKYDPDAPISFTLTDDLAAAHARLGQHDEAVALMRTKLARQKKLGQEGPSLYTTLSNLGTSLTYGAFTKAARGDAEALARFREGVEALRAALKSNPMAHFGRERWQVAVAEHLLAAFEKPGRLTEFDCLGNRLDLKVEMMLDRDQNHFISGHGRPARPDFVRTGKARTLKGVIAEGGEPDEPARWEALHPVRESITRIGAEEGTVGDAVPFSEKAVPFDEPMLGLVGLWRQGGGPEAHFALAIGETMLRVGQRYIAWAAFERAVRLADSFWPTPDLRDALIAHCRGRQKRIEETLEFSGDGESRRTPWQHVSPPVKDAVAALRPRFDAELAHGEAYQRAYQAYEAEKIAAGVPLSATFHDEFLKGSGPIASPSGNEEWFAYATESRKMEHAIGHGLSWGLLAAGVAALLTALVFRWWPRPTPPVTDAPLPPITSAGPDTDGRIQRGVP